MRLFITFIFIITLLTSTIYSQDEKSNALQLYTNGLEQYNGQNYEDAITLYTKAIVLNPGFA